MVNVLRASIKAASVSGIVVLWFNFTTEVFKMAWHIISTSPEDVMCEEYHSYFLDDKTKKSHL